MFGGGGGAGCSNAMYCDALSLGGNGGGGSSGFFAPAPPTPASAPTPPASARSRSRTPGRHRCDHRCPVDRADRELAALAAGPARQGGANPGDPQAPRLHVHLQCPARRQSDDLLVSDSPCPPPARERRDQTRAASQPEATGSAPPARASAIPLTGRGPQAVQRAKRLKLTAKGKFTPAGGAAIARQKTFTLRN